jgi:uncharacterized protein DUF4242
VDTHCSIVPLARLVFIWSTGTGRARPKMLGGKDMTAQGQAVRYIRSTFVPGEARCMCLFEAPTAQNVRELNDRAKIPYTRVVEALDLTP